jgi:hypothetical protein
MLLSCIDPNGDRWVFWRDDEGWHWSRRAFNGYEVGRSSRAYANRYSCIVNAKRNRMLGRPSLKLTKADEEAKRMWRNPALKPV